MISAMRRSWFLLVTVVLLAACARRTDMTQGDPLGNRTMPHPDGCYVQVWDRLQYAGASDFINGPREYATLRRMPNNRSWRNRIASVRVGPIATATAFTDEHFQGASVPLGPGTEHPAVAQVTSASIESLRVECADPRARP